MNKDQLLHAKAVIVLIWRRNIKWRAYPDFYPASRFFDKYPMIDANQFNKDMLKDYKDEDLKILAYQCNDLFYLATRER